MRLTVLLFLLISNSIAKRSDDANFIASNKQLYYDLFKDYYAHMSPYNTGSFATNEEAAEVHISLEYSHLTSVIEVQMTHINVFGLHIIYRDPRLVWDPSQYGNVSYIYVKMSDVWMPEISPCESSQFSLVAHDQMQKVKVNATGHLDFSMFGYASYICDFNMQDFPFDQHWCFYCFALVNYDEKELVFREFNGTEQLVKDTSEWKLKMTGLRYRTVRQNGKIKQNKGEIYFDFLITRRPTFWVMLIIVPAQCIGFLILLGLFFGTDPNNVNVAVNLGLVSFTSMTFIIGIIGGSLPKSQSVSILGAYIFLELLLIALAVLSVFFHETLCHCARKSFKWWTGESIHKVSPEHMDDEEGGRLDSTADTAHRLLKFVLERILERGVANFFFFLGLHMLNLAWLLCYAFADAPEMPFDYFEPSEAACDYRHHLYIMLIGVVVLAFVVCINAQATEDDSEEIEFINTNRRLYMDLFGEYYARQSPYNTGNKKTRKEPAKVYISLRYSHLTHVVEVQMTHLHVFGVELIWRDPRLTWDPTKYDNISYIYVRSSDLWIPELNACESSSFSLISSEQLQKATVNSTGHVELLLIGYASFICDFTVEHFPFDQHWCFYCFALPGYDTSELVFVGNYSSDKGVIIKQDSSEWKMKLHGNRHLRHPQTGQAHPTIIYFDFLITRRPSFWVLLIIIPAFLLGFLILLGLFFGKEKNNLNVSVNLGLIAFTSFTFIIGILADSLPKSGNISVLGWYIVVELAIITAAVISVSFHAALSSAAETGYMWWTGDNNVRPVSREAEEDAERKKSHITPRNKWLFFCVERVVSKGVLNFLLFLTLHVLNVVWMLSYALMVPPEMPADYFAVEDD